MSDNINIHDLKYDSQGLITAVVVDVHDQELLMVAYMTQETLAMTLEKKEAIFFSRSRKEIWHKGSTSGNVLKVINIYADCDMDCLKIEVEAMGDGVACHTGTRSCFFNQIL